ncbi:MAG: relaxase domain-containing protein [Negativicutes bacterium]|nr:relaxase domain-containing protein [Negativicutes bacterium]
MPIDYFAKDGYYTRDNTAHDRWEGTLAKAMGLEGQVTKEQFDAVRKELIENGREKCIAMDCSFSAPKSVSLAMAESKETRDIIQKLHQEAISQSVKYMEENYIKTRVTENGKTHEVKTGNLCAAEFEHYTSRNNDLDLHTHVVIENMTIHNGKLYSIDFRNIMSDQKEIGLIYRQNLAQALQREGYVLEITDHKHGFFELKGFDRETIMEHSTRRQEILNTMSKTGGTTSKDAQDAAMKTRKKKVDFDLETSYEEIKKEIFDSGKIKIERVVQNEHEGNQEPSNERGREEFIAGIATEPSVGIIRGDEGQRLRTLEGRYSLPNLSDRGLDETEKATHLLLPGSAVSRLAKLQADRERNAFMLRADAGERRQRIDAITASAIKIISHEKFAFTVPEIRQRIMGAGVLEGIGRQEAERAMERAGLVKLGRIEHGEEKSKDVYLTTEANIKREAAIIDRMKEGKGQVNSLTQEQSGVAFEKLKNQKESQNISFTPNQEQTNAIHHVLTSQDKYLCVQGLAGTGKTYTMTSIRELCEQEGITIRGACFTGKAADGLQNESGINSGTIHSFLNQLEKGKFNKNKPNVAPDPIHREDQQTAKGENIETIPVLGNENQREQIGIKQEWDFSKVEKVEGREIWVVDEAGLVDSKLMEQVQSAAEARGAQVVFSGDYQQLPPVGAGEPMRAMIEAGAGTAYLEDIRRQKNIELLEAVRESVKGDHLKTFEKLEKEGNYREVINQKKRVAAVAVEMTGEKLTDYKKNLLLVSTNADRKNYNNVIRAEYIKRGELDQGQEYKITSRDGDKETTEKRQFAAGDRIIFTANDNRLEVKNGAMGTIEKIENNVFTIRLDTGKLREVHIDKYNSIDHGYAVTNYKAQGMTVEKVVADMNTKGRVQDRNALYVDISRAKEKAVVFTDNKAKLEQQTKEFAKKISSKDFTEQIQKMERGNRIENNDRYHAPEKESTEKVIEKIERELEPLTQYKAQEKIKEQTQKVEQQQVIEKQKVIKRYGR